MSNNTNTKKINELKEMILKTPSAMAGVYAATKTLPKLIKGLNSKKAYEVYKNIGFKTFKTYTDSKGYKNNFTTLGINDVNTIAEKSINKSNVASTYEKNSVDKNQKNRAKPSISVEKNTDSHSLESYSSKDNEMNNDSLSFLEISPELKEAYTELLDEVYNKYNQERLTQFGEMSSEGLDYVLKESLTGFGKEIAKENIEDSKNIMNDTIEEKSANIKSQSRKEIHASENAKGNYSYSQSKDYATPIYRQVTVSDIAEENYEYNKSIDYSTQKYEKIQSFENNETINNNTYMNKEVTNNVDYLNTFDSVSKHLKEEEQLIDRESENEEFIEKTSKEKIVEKRLNFEELLNKSSLSDMQSVAENISSDLNELSQETYVEGEVTQNYYKSSRAQAEFKTFDINAPVDNEAYDDYRNLFNSEKTQYDIIPLGRTSEVIFRIEPSGDIFKHFNIGEKASKEHAISIDEYLRLKNQSLHFKNEVDLEKTKAKYKEEHMSL